jgi:HAMP domain-containing protein
MKHARNDGPDLAFRLGRRVVTAVADDMSTTQRVVAGVVAALVAVSPFGAWNEVEPQADPLAVGAPVEVGPFEVTIEKAATADELGHLVPAPGNHMLAVVANVTNTGDVPEIAGTLGSAVPAPENVGIIPQEPMGSLGAEPGTDPADDGATPSAAPSASAAPGDEGGSAEPELPSPSIVNIKDGADVRILNPGLTYRVALIWEQSGEFSGDVIPLRMVELEWVEEDPLGLDDGHWFANEIAFEGQIPVEAAKPAPSTEAEQQ